MKRIDEMISLSDAIKWMVGIGFWLFSMGGAYMMFKYRVDDHEKRIIKLENIQYVSKDDFNERMRDIRRDRREGRD